MPEPTGTQDLDEALARVTDAVREAQRLGLGKAHVNFHGVDAEAFKAARVLDGRISAADAAPHYHHSGDDLDGAFLVRTLSRGDVLVQLFQDVPVRELAEEAS